MLYNLLTPLADDYIAFNLFRYLTFRTGGAILTALVICLTIGPPMISWFKTLQDQGQPIRKDGPESHLAKAGTPTMGGVMILISVVLATVLWSDITSPFVHFTLVIMVGYGAIGMIDDSLKLTKRGVHGLAGRYKLLAQIVLGLLLTWGATRIVPAELSTHVTVPFFKDVAIDLGLFFPVWGLLVVVGASNAVNLTDGLDGLASVPIAIAAACFGLISYCVGHAVYSQYLGVENIPGAGELAVLCGAVIGGVMGFLWFNAPPAAIFMGDTGSLSMGGTLGAIAVLVKHELVLAIVGGLFVMETLSVMIQVLSFKLTGKRVFKMAPIHHHFEQKGWPETTVVVRFWIIAVVFAIIGLSTLKLR